MHERAEVLLGDDQNMYRGLRIDIRKGEHVIVLKEASDGNCARGDFAEEAVGVCSHVRMLNRGGYFLKYFGSYAVVQGL